MMVPGPCMVNYVIVELKLLLVSHLNIAFNTTPASQFSSLLFYLFFYFNMMLL